MRKAPPKMAKDLIKLAFSFSEGGKKTSAIMSLKNPKRAKSYHSNTFLEQTKRVMNET
jgi:hypothetical protein